MDSSGPAGSGDGWEILNSTFETGTGINYSHIVLQGGGGGRIVGNKLNAAGNGTQSIMNGIAIAPTHYAYGGYQMNPIYIIGNSIEGEKVGIAFVGAPGNDGISSSGVIIGNQMWANIDIYSAAGPVFPTWGELDDFRKHFEQPRRSRHLQHQYGRCFRHKHHRKHLYLPFGRNADRVLRAKQQLRSSKQ